MEYKVVRGKPFIGLAALDILTKTKLTVYGQNIKTVIANGNLGFVQKDVSIITLIETVEIIVGYG
ncbi:hypothetical protein C21_02806 [Arenibacter sp. NBRC 103722]|nr:hypothetical protein C21_02806 [Arenibacter sp. NBRC 103722]